MKKTSDITRPYKKVIHCQRKVSSNDLYNCECCKKEIEVGSKYFAIGLNATTAHEKFYSRRGCVWYKYCERCA
jgi:hypothetical protein